MSELKYEKLADEYKDTVVVQLRGGFYNVFNESAFVIGILLDYKVKESSNKTYKAGFPINALDKVVSICKREKVNFIAFDGNKIVCEHKFENNRFQEICREFDISSISRKEEQIEEKSSSHSEIENECKNTAVTDSKKQVVSFVQGQGINLENAIMDAQRTIQSFIDKGKEIISITLIENNAAGHGEIVMVQGLVIYK